MNKTIIGILIMLLSLEANNNWKHTNYKNEIDGSIVKRIITYSTNNIRPKAHLAIRCRERNLELIINWGSQVKDRPIVTTTIDNRQKETKQWSISTNKNATFSYNPKEILKKMINRQKFAASTQRKNGSQVTAVFDIKDIGREVFDIRRECK